ncbi:caspase family protein [Nocardia sp. NPDC057227]|uniref:VMAP-C domain-containing protein n=1 Tax=Nocardia sp. NPDC057227 TaxID=3346056 RepID=UPI003628161B
MTPERTNAIVVGLDKYGFGADRAGMATQALEFAKRLRNIGVPSENIVLLTSPLLDDSDGFRNLLANSANIDRLQDDVLALEGEVFWLHWGGHGMVDASGDRRLFVEDAIDKNLRNINLDNFLALLRSARARPLGRQIITVDACQTFIGQMTQPLPDGIPVPPGNLPAQGANQGILYASPYGTRAVHLNRLGGGVFSAALLDCLTEIFSTVWPPDLHDMLAAVKNRIEQLAPNYPDAARPIEVIYGDADGRRIPVIIVPTPASTTLPTHFRAELSSILAETGKVDPAVIVDTLWRSLRAVSPIAVDDAVDVETIVDRLDQLPRRPRRLPPVLSFVEYLAARLADPSLLRLWVDDACEELGIDAAAVNQTRTDATFNSPEAATFVTVKVDPAPGKDGFFTLNAAIERDGASLTLRLDDPDLCPAAEVRRRCESLVSRIGKFLPVVRGPTLTFEFLLPWSLLNEAVHHWSSESGGELGLRGKVVVRSLDRLRFDGLSMRDWQDRWNRLSAEGARILYLHADSALPQYYNSAGPAHLVIEHYDAKTLANRFLLAGDAVGVMLSYPYREGSGSSVDGLKAAVAAGMPVAVWCGSDCDSAPLKAVVEKLGNERGFARLPDCLFEERLQMEPSDVHHYRRDTTLLWDDPHRIPELTTPLASPTTSGTGSHDSHRQ